MSDLLDPKANVAFVIRGSLSGLTGLLAEISDLIKKYRAEVVFQTLSASRLFVQEDRGVRGEREERQ